jgi:hypothetical protein
MPLTEISEGNLMAYAVMMLSRGGEVNFDIPHSTRRIIVRQASIAGDDGSQTYASVFFHNRRLYQIVGTVPAGGSTADAIRFQQSFDFTDGWRLPDALSNELRGRNGGTGYCKVSRFCALLSLRRQAKIKTLQIARNPVPGGSPNKQDKLVETISDAIKHFNACSEPSG